MGKAKGNWFNKECFKCEKDIAWRAYTKKICAVKWGKCVMARKDYLTTRRKSALQFTRDVAAKYKTHLKLLHILLIRKLK